MEGRRWKVVVVTAMGGTGYPAGVCYPDLMHYPAANQKHALAGLMIALMRGNVNSIPKLQGESVKAEMGQRL